MLPKSTHEADYKAIRAIADEKALSKFQAKLSAANLFIKDGEAFGSDDGDGNYYLLKASESTRPQVVDRDRSPLYPEDAGIKMYSGTVVNVLIRPWVQDNTHGRKINANLLAVQRVADGERRTSAPSPIIVNNVFDSLADDLDDGL